MAKALFIRSDSSTFSLGRNLTRYFAVGNGNINGIAAETAAYTTTRNGGTFSNLTIRVTANTNTDDCTVTFRINEADGNQTVTIPALTTGEFTDSTNTDTVSAGDEIAIKIVAGVGSTGQTTEISAMSCTFADNSNTVTEYVLATTTNFSTASTTRYLPLGANTFQTDETRVQTNIQNGGTLDKLFVYAAPDNTRTTDTVVNTRINGADGNGTVTFGSGVSGILEDVSNTDTITAGDLVNLAFTTSTGTGTIKFRTFKIAFETTDSTWMLGTSGISFNTTASGVAYSALTAGRLAEGGTEEDIKVNCPFDCTLSQLWAYCDLYTSGTTTATLRVNGADTALTIAVNGTGEFLDSTHSVSVSAGDDLSLSISSTGVLRFNGFSLLGTTVTTPSTITGVGSITGLSTITF